MSGPLGSSTSLSGKYAEAAAYAARQTWSIQKQALALPPDEREELEHHYRLYCTAAVYDSVLFLEAAIIEFFVAVENDTPRITSRFSEAERDRLREYWSTQAGSLQPGNTDLIIDRYNEAMTITGNDAFDLASEPASSVQLVLAFCNALGQHAPIRQSADVPYAAHELEERLGDAGFALNPFQPDAPLPEKYLSHGGAEWAISTAVAFYGEFCSVIGVPNELDSPIVALGTRDDRSSCS